MCNVITQAGWNVSEIDQVNGHATATFKGDTVEAEAIKEVLGTTDKERIKNIDLLRGDNIDKSTLKNTVITAYKGHLGHLNLASGSTEVALSL